MRAATHAGTGDVQGAVREASIVVRDATRAAMLGLGVAALLLFIGYPLCWLVFGALVARACEATSAQSP